MIEWEIEGLKAFGRILKGGEQLGELKLLPAAGCHKHVLECAYYLEGVSNRSRRHTTRLTVEALKEAGRELKQELQELQQTLRDEADQIETAAGVLEEL